MSDEHFIVIGNGPAGHNAAVTLRLEAPGARITLISKEPHGCYRPHLLPKWISGTIKEESLYVCPVEDYKKMDIKFRSGQKVVALNPRPKGTHSGSQGGSPFQRSDPCRGRKTVDP